MNSANVLWCLFVSPLSSMLGTYSDEFGKLDFERSQHGSGMSNRSQAKRFISALHAVAERTYNNLFEFQQLRQIAKEVNIKVSENECLRSMKLLIVFYQLGEKRILASFQICRHCSERSKHVASALILDLWLMHLEFFSVNSRHIFSLFKKKLF